MNRNPLTKIYDLNRASYEKVCDIGKDLLEKALKAEKIDLLLTSARVKSFESFYEKIARKQYHNPSVEVEDICGLRVVCFYSKDLEKIHQIIKNTFYISDFIDKGEIQDPDRFGYRSNHYIVKLPKLGLRKELLNFKIEIQCRTILMHAWAHIQGKLEYKKEEHIPKEFKRKLHQISAILELADEQFQAIKMDKDIMRNLLSAGETPFSDSTEMNIDTFMSYMDSTFPKRKMRYRYSKLLMKELLSAGIGFEEIIESHKNGYLYIEYIEKEKSIQLSQEEAMKLMLYLTHRAKMSVWDDDQLITDNLELINRFI